MLADTLIVGLFCASSILMIVVNKLLIEIFPFSLELLLVQNFVASTLFACFYSDLSFDMSKAQLGTVPCFVLYQNLQVSAEPVVYWRPALFSGIPCLFFRAVWTLSC